MAEKDIIQNMVARLGQSQDERMPRELDVHFADVEERSSADLLRFARLFAPYVRHYPGTGGPSGTWAPFFDYDAAGIERLIAANDGEQPPHLALFLAFLEIYKKPKEVINAITGRHLDFYYRDVLRLAERAAVPDRAHLTFEAKKGAAPFAIGPDHLFTAGKDAAGVELIYRPVRETIINGARVDRLHSIHLDRSGRGTIRHAPLANSADGLGAKLVGDEPSWPAFGGATLPPGEIGFALSSPVLRMQEGRRTVTATLTLGSADPKRINNTTLTHAFDVFITGPKGWLGPIAVSPTILGNGTLTFGFTLDEKQPAVVDYNAAVHGYAYAADAPVMQALLRSEARTVGYLDFAGVRVLSAAIDVDVANITSLTLENDHGTVDPKKAFAPFGAQPTAGSRLMIGCPEALRKNLARLSVAVRWKDVPASGRFNAHYANYNVAIPNNDYFTAGVTFRDGGGHEFSGTRTLFETNDAHAVHELSFTPASRALPVPVSTGGRIQALSLAGSSRALFEAGRYVLRMPVYAAYQAPLPPERDGFITLALGRDFLHATYRRRLTETIVEGINNKTTPVALNEPYTPTVQSITLSYSAHSHRVNLISGTLDDFAGADVRFYHVMPFGQRREHSYLRRQAAFLANTSVTLLPTYERDGELLIGLAGLSPGDSVSMLFQVSEGSADPRLKHVAPEWWVMSDNYWKRLGAGELALDTTNGLLASGVVGIVVPTDATIDNRALPAGYIWLRATIAGPVAAVSRLIEVTANAAEVRFVDGGNDPSHLRGALAAGSITKPKGGISGLKATKQPYASFGGRPAEASDPFHTRVAERLRHKNRCITPWDYERVVLEAFPRVHRVKCIPHAREGAWEAPGNVLLVVVPDLKNRNAMDPLQPRVDADTIDRITRHVAGHAGMGVRVKVVNPRYQRVRLEFKVRFRAGHEFNYYRRVLETELIRTLAPWAFDARREITFGGTLYKSVLLDVVEDLDYVDYVTDFRMFSFGDVPNMVDVNDVRAETPDMILVSDYGHTIMEVV